MRPTRPVRKPAPSAATRPRTRAARIASTTGLPPTTCSAWRSCSRMAASTGSAAMRQSGSDSTCVECWSARRERCARSRRSRSASCGFRQALQPCSPRSRPSRARAMRCPRSSRAESSRPRSRLTQVLSAVGEIGEHCKLPVANVFHAGDGNLHPNILFDLRDREVMHQVEGAGEEMLRAVVELGGALSGEHGIGLEKSAFMPWVYTPDDLDAMQRVKDGFDVDGILNPGKIFPDPTRKHGHLAGRTCLAIEAKWW